MPVAFNTGQELGRNDLHLFLVNEYGVPINAAKVTYAIYYVDKSMGEPGVEVLIGAAERTPVNPSVGEYYAALLVPPGAAAGTYRIRWKIQKLVNSEFQEVVQEFAVVAQAAQYQGLKLYSPCEAGMIDKLRIFLRDNCVGGEEMVEVDANGVLVRIGMEDLHGVLSSQNGHLFEHRGLVHNAFHDGKLLTRSVSMEGVVEWKRVIRTHRAEVGPETIWRLTTQQGSSIVTGGHRVYLTSTTAVDAETLRVGDLVLCLVGGKAEQQPLLGVQQEPTREVMFDLCVEGNHNLFLANSTICAHNSPDRNYHFRPPEQEGVIKRYNRVFGYIWEDHELYAYLEMSLNWWNSMPPETEGMSSLNLLCQQKPGWSTFILWGAAVHALFALALNWAADEFSISSREMVKVYLPDGRALDVSMGDLWEIIHSEP